MAEEQWRPVPGYEDLYEVSDRGRVRRSAPGRGTWAGRMLRPLRHSSGYRQVTFSRSGVERVHLVHRVVAAAFLGPFPPGQEVNHEDGDKTNNAACNLSYVTQSGNTQHALRLGLMKSGEAHYAAILTAPQVLDIRAKWKTGRFSLHGLARQFGVSLGAIHGVVYGKNWKQLEQPVAHYG